jgi:lysophospholipase L1-like esterase
MGSPASSDPDRTNEAAGRYAAAVRKLGAKHGVAVLDLHAGFQRDPEWATTLLMEDGLHLSTAGQARVAQLLLKLLDAEFPEIA